MIVDTEARGKGMMAITKLLVDATEQQRNRWHSYTLATFLLGMFWARTTATGAFLGLFGGIGASATFHALTLAQGNAPGVKGGYLGVQQVFPSEMAQNFWLAAVAFLVCLLLTATISLIGKRTKTDEELKGLVYSLTPKIVDSEQGFFARPAVLGTMLLIVCVIMNYIFW